MKESYKEKFFQNYKIIIDYLNGNGIGYRECSYGYSPYIVIDSKKIVIVIRRNGSNYQKHSRIIYERYIENGYKGKIFTNNMISITSISKLLSIKVKNKVTIKKDKPKKNKKVQETSYDFAERMLKNPTKAEKQFSKALDSNGIEYQQQVVLKCKNSNKKYIADFVIGNTIVEVDGGYHHTETQQKSDEKRTTKLEELGYVVLRIENDDVLKYTENMIGIINKLKN